jgi:hypothetical protein
VPLENALDLRMGKKNKKPQIPPQTIRGYNQLGFNAGEMDTPNDLVIPKSPDNHTTRLLTRAPKHPAAKKINTLFIVFSHKFRFMNNDNRKQNQALYVIHINNVAIVKFLEILHQTSKYCQALWITKIIKRLTNLLFLIKIEENLIL